jgi:hypothetical protein
MIKKEHLLSFAIDLSHIMEKEPLDKEVPNNYIENQLKMWLNEKFKIDPEIPLK